MGLGNFVTFDDHSEDAKATPKKKPQPKKQPSPKVKSKKVEPKVVVVEPQPKPKKVKQEKEIFSSDYNREETTKILERISSNKKKIAKDVYNNIYKGKITMLGSLIKPTDKIVHVMMITGENILGSEFISVSPRIVAEREIKTVAKKYISLDSSRREPLLVEAKYMEGVDYQKHRQRIAEQFL